MKCIEIFGTHSSQAHVFGYSSSICFGISMSMPPLSTPFLFLKFSLLKKKLVDGSK